MSARVKLAVAAVAVSLFALVVVLSASASAVSHAPTQSVIVVFKNQDRAQPATRSALGARRRTIAGNQGGVLQHHASGKARDVHSFTTLNAVSATVSPAQVSSLEVRVGGGGGTFPNGVVHLAPPEQNGCRRRLLRHRDHAAARRVRTPGRVQLEPEALKTMSVDSDNPNAKTAPGRFGITGAAGCTDRLHRRPRSTPATRISSGPTASTW